MTGLETAGDVSSLAERIYGRRLVSDSRPGVRRVLHPTAVWRRADGALLTLKINEHAPRSVHDFFVLNLCRARTDAIVTTGKILREEPDLRHDLQGPERVGEALHAWRREELGKTTAPRTLVLTSGRGLDLSHPLFGSDPPPVVLTSHDGYERLGDAVRAGIDVVAEAEPGLRPAITLLRGRYAAATVSVETGPSTSTALYMAPVTVDELLLSICEAPDLDERAQGGPFVDLGRIAELFERPCPAYRVDAADGVWRFSRYLRR